MLIEYYKRPPLSNPLSYLISHLPSHAPSRAPLRASPSSLSPSRSPPSHDDFTHLLHDGSLKLLQAGMGFSHSDRKPFVAAFENASFLV